MRRTTRIPSFAAAALIAAAGLSVAVPAEAQSRRAAPAAERSDWPARAAPAQARAVTFAAAAAPSGSLVLPLASEAEPTRAARPWTPPRVRPSPRPSAPPASTISPARP
ncbi:hypothetical protein V8F63_05255 [Brevundimonas sp. LF-1]|uniref:hypothetical protein n=1 Tax=Brevundimonas sp. LF-1 TaxID=3126100 RepID=UPI0030E2536D